MNSSDHTYLLFFLAIIFFSVVPRVTIAGIEFLSTPALEQQSFEEGGAFEKTRFQFSSEGKPVSFHFSGESFQSWETNPVDPPGVLDYAYLGLRLRHLNTDFSLGRVLIDEGTTEELMDGVYSRTRFATGGRVSFFSGRTAGAANDLLGGKLSYRFHDRVALSMSYLNESAGPETLREEALVNLRLHPFDKLALSGSSLFDLEKQVDGAFLLRKDRSFRPGNLPFRCIRGG